jgi:hypothetical protein
MDELLADILNTCLLQLDTGASVDECLAAYPQQRAILEAPLRAAARVRALPHAAMPAATRSTLEARMLTLAAQRRTAQAMPSAPPPGAMLGPAALLAGILRVLGYRGPLSQPWLRVAVAALGLLLALTLGAGTLAAARALIRVVQGPTILPTSTPLGTRSFTFEGPIEQISPESWVVNGIPIGIGAQTRITGTPAVGSVAQISGAMQPDGTMLAQTVTIAGVLPTSSTPPLSTVLPAPTSTPTPILTATPAPSSTPTPIPTATPPPPAGTNIDVTGVIQQITIINNITIIVVNDISYVLPPNLVIIVGERLRIGAPIVFVGEWNAVGKIIIINIVEIDGQPIVITPPKPSDDDDDGDDDDDDDD